MPSAGPTILLVEQDIVVRHPLAEYLRECGFKVIEAQNGDQAKLVLNNRDARIDVVLADMTTKDSGFALHHWIKANYPEVDVILAGSLERSVDKAGELCNEGPQEAIRASPRFRTDTRGFRASRKIR